jgi:hypothetical protein
MELVNRTKRTVEEATLELSSLAQELRRRLEEEEDDPAS